MPFELSALDYVRSNYRFLFVATMRWLPFSQRLASALLVAICLAQRECPSGPPSSCPLGGAPAGICPELHPAGGCPGDPRPLGAKTRALRAMLLTLVLGSVLLVWLSTALLLLIAVLAAMWTGLALSGACRLRRCWRRLLRRPERCLPKPAMKPSATTETVRSGLGRPWPRQELMRRTARGGLCRIRGSLVRQIAGEELRMHTGRAGQGKWDCRASRLTGRDWRLGALYLEHLECSH